jgi:hypothetical protein
MPAPLSSTSLLPGFPTDVGGKRLSCIDHAGPASYSQVVTGSPPTGGDTVTAVEFGMKWLDAVWGCALSDDGQYEVELSPAGSANEPSSFIAEWIIAATGAQVNAATNLSARKIRLMAIGY